MSYNYDCEDYDYEDYGRYENEYSNDGGCDGGSDNNNNFNSQSHYPESTYSDYEPPSKSNHGEFIYGDNEEIDECPTDLTNSVYGNKNDISGCASWSNDTDWDDLPSELNYHNHELTPLDLDHHNLDTTMITQPALKQTANSPTEAMSLNGDDHRVNEDDGYRFNEHKYRHPGHKYI